MLVERMIDYRYPGGKGAAGLAEWIVAMQPTHSVYVEPFVGKGAVFRRKPPALRSFLVDKCDQVVAWWQRLAPPAATIIRGDGIDWIEAHGEQLDADALVYCDPPYMLATRTNRRIYAHEMSDGDHRRLLAAVRELRCPIMLSGYASRLYDRQLASWRRFVRPTITRGAVLRDEIVWCNFDPRAASPNLAIEYSQLGRNFRQRERVSRKVARWRAKFEQMSADERRAILGALLDAEFADRRGHRRKRR